MAEFIPTMGGNAPAIYKGANGWPIDIEGSVTGDITGDITGNVTGDVTGDLTGNVVGNLTGDVAGIIQLTSYTVATLPDAATGIGKLIAVIDGDTGNPCLAYSNGTNWLRIVFGAAVAAA